MDIQKRPVIYQAWLDGRAEARATKAGDPYPSLKYIVHRNMLVHAQRFDELKAYTDGYREEIKNSVIYVSDHGYVERFAAKL